jgi:SAM-dependent methyltransferase
MRQADVFLMGEGDAWFARNKDRLGQVDPVSNVIERMSLHPKSVLEVGCANGWRLAKLRDTYGCEVMGVDPSQEAALEAAKFRVPVFQASATNLPTKVNAYDLVIFGFCLYLTDPDEWLRIAAEANWVIKDSGHIIIHDFADVAAPYARPYRHREGVMSHHFDFANLWLAHPWYHVAWREVGDEEMITVIKKSPRFEVRE